MFLCRHPKGSLRRQFIEVEPSPRAVATWKEGVGIIAAPIQIRSSFEAPLLCAACKQFGRSAA